MSFASSACVWITLDLRIITSTFKFSCLKKPRFTAAKICQLEEEYAVKAIRTLAGLSAAAIPGGAKKTTMNNANNKPAVLDPVIRFPPPAGGKKRNLRFQVTFEKP